MSWLTALARTCDPRRLPALGHVYLVACAAVLGAALFLGGPESTADAGIHQGYGHARTASAAGAPCVVEPDGAGAASYGYDAPGY